MIHVTADELAYHHRCEKVAVALGLELRSSAPDSGLVVRVPDQRGTIHLPHVVVERVEAMEKFVHDLSNRLASASEALGRVAERKQENCTCVYSDSLNAPTS